MKAAASRSWAVARVALPQRVRCTKYSSPTIRPRATTTMRTRTNGTVTGPIETAHAFGIRRPVSTSLNRAPNRRIAAVWRKSETPSPLMITPMLRALRSGRYAKRSIPYPSPPQTIIASPSAATTMTSPGSRSVGSAEEPADDEPAGETPGDEDLAVAEIDHPEDPVDHRVAERDERVDHADGNAVDELLENDGHARLSAAGESPARREENSRSIPWPRNAWPAAPRSGAPASGPSCYRARDSTESGGVTRRHAGPAVGPWREANTLS